MKLWFGKYVDVELSDVPKSYLVWMANAMRSESLRDLARNELNCRAAGSRNRRTADSQNRRTTDPRMDELTREIVEAGYRTLAKKYHPDHGGDSEKMQKLNATIERLRNE